MRALCVPSAAPWCCSRGLKTVQRCANTVAAHMHCVEARRTAPSNLSAPPLHAAPLPTLCPPTIPPPLPSPDADDMDSDAMLCCEGTLASPACPASALSGCEMGRGADEGAGAGTAPPRTGADAAPVHIAVPRMRKGR